MTMDTTVVRVKIDSLKPYTVNNAIRDITKDKYQDLKLKIKKYGQLGTLLIDGRDKQTILGGNHAYVAMKELGFDMAKVEYRHPRDDAEALELVILHNERYAGWIEQGLAELLYKYKEKIDLSQYTIDLGRTTDLKAVLARYGNTDEDEFDVGAAIPDKPISQPGEIYTLGRHRLMCGDSTNSEHVEALMNKKQASVIVTDPPYGVSYEGNRNGTETEMIANDDLRGDKLQQFLYHAFNNAAEHLIKNAPTYVFYASSNHREFQNAIELAGFSIKQQIIWVKHMVIGNNDYHWAHEPVLYCQKGKDRGPFYGDRTNTTVIKEVRYEDIAKMSKERLIEILTQLKSRSTVQYASQDSLRGDKYVHPTQKPIAILTPFIKNSSVPEEIVLDLFAGSGSTMVAAHQLDRVTYLMEFDPKFCDVIRKRYAHLIKADDQWQESTPIWQQ